MLVPLRECDLSKIDLRQTIALGQWEAVKHEVHRRAHAERDELVRDLANRLWSWWARRNEPRDLIGQMVKE